MSTYKYNVQSRVYHIIVHLLSIYSCVHSMCYGDMRPYLISLPTRLNNIIFAQTIPYSYAYIGTDARVAACKRVRDAGGQLPSAKKGERSTQGWLNGDIALTR